MHSNAWVTICSPLALASIFWVGLATQAAPPKADTTKVAPAKADTADADKTSEGAKSKDASASKANSDDKKRIPLVAARKRAKLVHSIYATTLGVMHHRYFRGDRTAIPARAMEDVFTAIAREERIEAKWIAINTKAMSINHRAKGKFEKEAATRIAAGDADYEAVEDGIYRRVQGISLMNGGCLGCHMGFGAADTKIKRFAGLVIAIPVTEE